MSEKIIYAILGPGVSGVGAGNLLASRGESFAVIGNEDPKNWMHKFESSQGKVVFFQESDTRLDTVFDDFEVLILSPGIPLDHPIVQRFRRAEKKIINEIDLAYDFYVSNGGSGTFIGVTGSNGKTTTVSLLNEILIADGRKSFLGGNIGEPLSTYFSGSKAADFYILELSSFQLESLSSIKFNIGAFLNFTSTHEERYKTKNDYFEAKMNLKKLSQKLFFGDSLRPLVNDSESNFLLSSILDRFDLSKWKLIGEHNLENLRAAVTISLELGVSDKSIQSVIDSFESLEFRVQSLGKILGKTFYNDSKSTNIESTKKAISGFNPSELTLIIGGKVRDDSLVDLEGWKKLLLNISKVIVIGEASKFFSTHIEFENMIFLDSFKELPTDLENYNETVLFSPGFPSFDEFKNYVERGESFNRFFNDLKLTRKK